MLDLKTDKVISSFQFGEGTPTCNQTWLFHEIPFWSGWRLALVGYILTEGVNGVSFLVAAIKHNRVVLTGITVEGEDLQACDSVDGVTVVDKGFRARFDTREANTSVTKLISVTKRAAKGANVKKFRL